MAYRGNGGPEDHGLLGLDSHSVQADSYVSADGVHPQATKGARLTGKAALAICTTFVAIAVSIVAGVVIEGHNLPELNALSAYRVRYWALDRPTWWVEAMATAFITG